MKRQLFYCVCYRPIAAEEIVYYKLGIIWKEVVMTCLRHSNNFGRPRKFRLAIWTPGRESEPRPRTCELKSFNHSHVTFSYKPVLLLRIFSMQTHIELTNIYSSRILIFSVINVRVQKVHTLPNKVKLSVR
jgi:hypothetical protein